MAGEKKDILILTICVAPRMKCSWQIRSEHNWYAPLLLELQHWNEIAHQEGMIVVEADLLCAVSDG
jgi:hypothetical protein